MSTAHESHDAHGSRGAAHAHTHDGHGAHGEHGHEEPWGDYNAELPEPSPLPPVNPMALGVFALALLGLLAGLAFYSVRLADEARPAAPSEDGAPAHH